MTGVEDERPWRHASWLQLRNMVNEATRQWQSALKDREVGKAALIRRELDAVNRELDARATRR